MKQIIQNYKTGKLTIEEVPMPKAKPGGALIKNAFSLVSLLFRNNCLDKRTILM